MARNGRILVVDDDAIARKDLAAMLTAEGFVVETAADAFKGLGKLTAFTPHVVVTDLKMPGMGGIELANKLRGLEDAPSVIVITGFSEIDTAIEAMRNGAIDYLGKPLDFRKLLALIDRTLEKALGAEPVESNIVVESPRGARRPAPRIPGATLAEITRYAILETLEATGGSTTKAAEILGISARTIQYKLHEYSEARSPAASAPTASGDKPS